LSGAEYENAEVQDEFYDAIAAESSTSDDESDEDDGLEHKVYLNLVNYNKICNRNRCCLCVTGLKQRKSIISVKHYNLLLFQIFQDQKVKLKNISWAMASLPLKRTTGQFLLMFDVILQGV